MGILLAGLIAAFMSTFASTVNAAPAYLVNDIYLRYINPSASNKTLIRASYIVSVSVVLISTVIGLYVQSINSVLQWLVSGLWGGYVISNVLKWYWWRLNGQGYFYGMLSGIVGALLFPPIFKSIFPDVAGDIVPLTVFPLILITSGIICVVTSLYTQEDDREVLKCFYRTVNPWGFWGPVKADVLRDDPNFKPNPHFKRDMQNIVVGVITQTCLVALPIFIVIKEWQSMATTMAILLISALVLKKNWYDKLRTDAL